MSPPARSILGWFVLLLGFVPLLAQQVGRNKPARRVVRGSDPAGGGRFRQAAPSYAGNAATRFGSERLIPAYRSPSLCQRSLIWFVLLLSFLSLSAQAQNREALRASVVRIKAVDNGIEKTGAGFVVRVDASGAWILTAAHVVVGDPTPQVEFYQQQNNPIKAVQVNSDADNPRGLALLKLANGYPAGLAALPLGEDLQRDDEHLVIIGHPLALAAWNTIEGRVSGLNGLDVILQAEIKEGNSGGPVLKDEKVAGMVIKMPQSGFGIALNSSIIRQNLQGWGVSLQAVTALPPVVTAPQVTSRAVCGYCPEMIRLNGGEFWMGSADSDKEAGDGEKNRHKVSVKPFSLSKYEVTKGQYAAFVKEKNYPAGDSCQSYKNGFWGEPKGANWLHPGFTQQDDEPVVCVSFADVQAYIAWLNEKTHQQYRLPKEAEWEYAARAGTPTSRYWGDDSNKACQYANVADQTAQQTFPDWTIHACADGYTYTAPVGSFKPNQFGLQDMLGNVWEWTCSAYTDPYAGEEKVCANDAVGWRVVRGGSWVGIPTTPRSATRDRLTPDDRFSLLGFRLAQD